jgi:D-alanyl-lipoteichoic acid acyltransferase DltB (MBOAT superfamily)
VFWKKWHISLTSWFRDYIYIPLGGNKRSRAKYVRNIIVIFTLSGLWHGAGINFILWGFLHALAYLLFVLFLRKIKIELPKAISYLFTFVLAAFIFVFFRNGKIGDSLLILQSIFHITAVPFQPISLILLLNIVFIFTIEYFAKEHNNYSSFLLQNSYTKNTLLIVYMLFALLTFSGVDNLPFIYFQF